MDSIGGKGDHGDNSEIEDTHPGRPEGGGEVGKYGEDYPGWVGPNGKEPDYTDLERWINRELFTNKEDQPMRTSQERKQLHEAMWAIIRDIGCSKEEALIRMGIPENLLPINECFACEEAGWRSNADPGMVIGWCSRCPILWGNEEIFKWHGALCIEDGSPYKGYGVGNTKRIAASILALPYKGSWLGIAAKKTLYDTKVGDIVWFRDGSEGKVLIRGDEVLKVRFCGNNNNYRFDGTLNGFPEYGQVIHATYQDVLDQKVGSSRTCSWRRLRRSWGTWRS
jgi:hypothetical protein